MIPYGRQSIDQDDIDAVIEVLKSDWLTTGPKVEAFEEAVAGYVGVCHGIAVSNGTAALHCAMHALDVGPSDEVIVPTITFVATANAVIYQSATPVFADVDPETLLIDPVSVESLITPKTVAIVAMDYAGQPCDYSLLRQIANKHNLALVADAAHSVGAKEGNKSVGTLADLTTFSFHPVKGMTTGEGGMVVTDDECYAKRIRSFRNHGLNMDLHQRRQAGMFSYEMTDLGFNYRLTDIQCALGLSQLPKLDQWVARRAEIADRYIKALTGIKGINILSVREEVAHAYHLFVVKVDADEYGMDRDQLFCEMRERRIGVNVHYSPVHLQPFYQHGFGTKAGQCPNAEKVFGEILSLPMFPGLTNQEVDQVIEAISDLAC